MHLGLIGYGSIATALAELLARGPAPARLTALARPGRGEAARAALSSASCGTYPLDVVEDAADLIAAAPDLAVEAAGHAAVRDTAPALLRAGIDTIVVSVGALAEAELEAALHAAARAGGARMILPAGAVGGIDLLAALAAAGGLEVYYRGTKSPAAWKGTPAEDAVALDTLDAPATFFTGTARAAAAAYPRNANVAATLALAGAGFEATRVELVADPAAPGNSHAYAVHSPVADMEIRIANRPSAGNLKTSASTIYSVLREIRNRIGPVAI